MFMSPGGPLLALQFRRQFLQDADTQHEVILDGVVVMKPA